jgi:hypothetical protein
LAKGADNFKDNKITFNSKTGLIEGWCADAKSGNIYNDYIIGGDFFKIPVTITRTPSGKEEKITIFTIGSAMAAPGVFDSLKYNYYYL